MATDPPDAVLWEFIDPSQGTKAVTNRQKTTVLKIKSMWCNEQIQHGRQIRHGELVYQCGMKPSIMRLREEKERKKRMTLRMV